MKIVVFVIFVIVAGGLTLFFFSPWDTSKKQEYKGVPAVSVQPQEVYTENGDQITEDEALSTYNEMISRGGKEAEDAEQKGIDGIQAPNPFGDELINRAHIDDKKAQKYILYMASDKKKITKQRVRWLLYAVSMDKMGLKHKNVYNKILNRWKNNDFSQFESDKQKILNLQK
ncbi:DUF6241 domain-containing protein [Sporolactobacillus nakayamae]|uniref:Uncharacterized protein n=1 Tax=Sporolactobacillus nakayamae TaxID=269670 RepID=A0A1I2QMK7_9BACL|nr:DUF6241 domain-containing protein [Sporolactobacillus nakayamae]SFG29614.1 hypothetical protein SAMN02982927_01294 [Sporolactobacillus nakayamae]